MHTPGINDALREGLLTIEGLRERTEYIDIFLFSAHHLILNRAH